MGPGEPAGNVCEFTFPLASQLGRPRCRRILWRMVAELLLWLVLAGAVAGGCVLLAKRRLAERHEIDAKRERDNLDTVAGWPPEATRLLTGGERAAHAVLVKALPECRIFPQVSLSRFIRVSRRNSYSEWMSRVGNLSVDFVICDRASLVIAAVALRPTNESEGAAGRRARVARVLKAAGLKFFIWREESIPTPAAARSQIIAQTGEPDAAPASAAGATPKASQQSGMGHGKLPVPEVLAETADDSPRREPPPSTWFDDLDSGPAPLDPARK